MSTRHFTYDHVMAAMIIMEEIARPSLSGEPWRPYQEKWGIYGLRDVVITSLAWLCHEAWTRAVERHTDGEHSVGPNVEYDPGAFDAEFVPFWLRTCIDWEAEHPRVLGSKP